MLNIFAYRKPFEKKIYCGYSQKTLSGINPDSFVICPFKGGRSDIVSIPQEHSFEIEELDNFLVESCCLEQTSDLKSPYPFPESSTSQQEHASGVTEIRRLIRKGDLAKCVMAKVFIGSGRIKIRQTFENLCKNYPGAFVFFFCTPESGCWMGASPELLISKEKDILKTMALAGTRPITSDIPWDNKNLEEHKVVTDFIIATLAEKGIEAHCDSLSTIDAGPVQHLMTRISGKIEDDDIIADLVDSLSPTPALSGMPRDIAFETIDRLENFNRGFYGGFCGYVSYDMDMLMYVNIRSMRIEKTRYSVFAGGGIMADSDPKSEWSETENKARTLLSKLIYEQN